jgi:hypothetical protein
MKKQTHFIRHTSVIIPRRVCHQKLDHKIAVAAHTNSYLNLCNSLNNKDERKATATK